MDWGHIGSGFLLVAIFLITLPFLGDVGHLEHERRAQIHINEHLNETYSKEKLSIEVIESEIRLLPNEEKELENDKTAAATIQMERPKKPSM